MNIIPNIITNIKNRIGNRKFDVDSLDIISLVKYLKHYKYIGDDFTIDEFNAAVKKLQNSFGLSDNEGVVTPQTMTAIAASRCGCPEEVRSEEMGSIDKWAFNHIQYYIEDFVPGLTKDEVRAIYKRSYDSVTAVCGMTFEEVSSSNRANLVMRTGSKNGLGSPSGVLAYAYIPQGPNHSQQLEAVFDLAEIWIDNPRQRGILLQNVHCHESGGHNMGLLHSTDPNALMATYYSASVAVPQSDDIRRLQNRYGKPVSQPEPTPTPTPVPKPVPTPGAKSLTITLTGDISSVEIPGYRINKLS